jgi:hypothetical protein
MALNLDNAKAGKQNQPKPQATASTAITKSPALDKLQAQLQTQADNLEASARAIVREGMEQAKLQVRDANSEELEAIASDDDFFDISSLFGGEEEQTALPNTLVVDITANAS